MELKREQAAEVKIKHMTPQLKQLLNHLQSTQTPEEHLTFLSGVEKLYKYYQNALAHHAPGSSRAIAAQSLMERELSRIDSSEVTCHKGCAHCCHFEVEVSFDEAELLALLVNEGIEIDRLRLQKLSEREKGSTQWHLPIRSENRCVFLNEENACRIYNFRPLVCRKCRVVSSPQECATVDGQVNPQYLPIAEIILSAVVGLEANGFTSMPKGLHAGLQRTSGQQGHA